MLKSFLESTSKESISGRDHNTTGCLGDGGSGRETGEVQGVLGNSSGGRCNEGRGGLNALVHKYMGKPLDKSQQISNWERRPLKPEQVKYAGMVCVCPTWAGIVCMYGVCVPHLGWDSGVCVPTWAGIVCRYGVCVCVCVVCAHLGWESGKTIWAFCLFQP